MGSGASLSGVVNTTGQVDKSGGSRRQLLTEVLDFLNEQGKSGKDSISTAEVQCFLDIKLGNQVQSLLPGALSLIVRNGGDDGFLNIQKSIDFLEHTLASENNHGQLFGPPTSTDDTSNSDCLAPSSDHSRDEVPTSARLVELFLESSVTEEPPLPAAKKEEEGVAVPHSTPPFCSNTKLATAGKEVEAGRWGHTPKRAAELAWEEAKLAEAAEKKAHEAARKARDIASRRGMPQIDATYVSKRTKSVHEFSHAEWPMRLIPFDAFISSGEIPRSDFALPMVLLDDLLMDNELRGNSCIVFISHRWWSGGAKIPHPDQEAKKFMILVGALKLILNSLDSGAQLLVWIDYFGIDQDDSEKKLAGIRSLPYYMCHSDAVLTPWTDTLYGEEDQEEEESERRGDSPLVGTMWWLAEYRSLRDHPEEYLGRAWCRLELYLATNAPLAPGGYGYFQRRGLARAGRPHFLSGDHSGGRLDLLPPLNNTLLERLPPVRGAVHDPRDVGPIEGLVAAVPQRGRTDHFLSSFDLLKPCDPMMNGLLTEALQLIGEASGGGVLPGRWGETARRKGGKGKPQLHGYGVEVLKGGSKFEGQWRHGQRWGWGVSYLASGAQYSCKWEGRGAVGHGTYRWPQGNVYLGQCDGFFEGLGVMLKPGEGWHAGEFHKSKMHGPGVWVEQGDIMALLQTAAVSTLGSAFSEKGKQEDEKQQRAAGDMCPHHIQNTPLLEGSSVAYGTSSNQVQCDVDGQKEIRAEGVWLNGEREGSFSILRVDGAVEQSIWEGGYRHGLCKVSYQGSCNKNVLVEKNRWDRGVLLERTQQQGNVTPIQAESAMTEEHSTTIR